MDKTNSILALQYLYFEIQDLERYSVSNVAKMVTVITKYSELVASLHEDNPKSFDNFFHIGVQELNDHFQLLQTATSAKCKRLYFEDFSLYLSEAILDVRRKCIKMKA